MRPRIFYLTDSVKDPKDNHSLTSFLETFLKQSMEQRKAQEFMGTIAEDTFMPRVYVG